MKKLLRAFQIGMLFLFELNVKPFLCPSMKKFCLPFFAIILAAACEQTSNQALQPEIYEGPAVEMDSVDMVVSDSTVIKVRLLAKKQLILENDDREFPEGIYVQFFNQLGIVGSILKANKGYYYKKENYYLAEGNVIMKNLFNGDELSTEELKWFPKKEEIKTDKFVTIKSEGEVHTGQGLEASEDFDEYTILEPSGTIGIEEDDDFDERPTENIDE